MLLHTRQFRCRTVPRCTPKRTFAQNYTTSCIDPPFRQLAHDLQRLFPQLLVASRSCTSDYSLGAPSKYLHNYDIHYPAAKVQHHQFASDILVDTDSKSRTTDHDDEMKYIQFAYLLQETLDDIIHDAYGKLPSVGLLCYPEIQDLVIQVRSGQVYYSAEV